jgi:hypothetical protein
MIDKNITVVEALKTIARFWSILSISLILLFIIGEGLDPSKLTSLEWLGFFFFPFGLTMGLIIAWSKELIGGIITIVSVAAFAVVMNVNLYVAALGFPAVLFIIHDILTKEKIKKRDSNV